MKRTINFRPLLFVFLGMFLGIVFASFIIQKNIVAFIVFSIVLLLSTFSILYVKLFKRTEKSNFVINFVLCLLIGLTIGFGSGLINYTTFSKKVVDENSKVFVTARVEVCNYNSNYYILTLENLKFYDSSKTIEPDGKMRLTFSSESEVENLGLGSTISFYASVFQNSLFEDGNFNSYYYKNNLRFSASTTIEDLIITAGNLKFDEKFKQKVENILYSNMDYDSASLAYASIFGDKTMLNQNIYSLFSISGTAHILAVSGLHVGFLVALIYWVLNKFKLKDKYCLIILAVLLSLYCYLCQFSPSVVRASIMSLVLCFSKVVGKQNDNLSSISIAAIIILLIKPFYLFDLGFELSFASCFGIFLLMPQFERLLKKFKILNKFTSAVSLTLSAQLGTFPILVSNFDKMSFLTVLANIVIVPLFGVVFTILISVVLINLIVNLGFLFIIPNYLLKVIILLARIFGSFESAMVSVSGFSVVGNIFFYLMLFCISRFLIIKNYFKYVLVGICAIMFIISAIIGLIPTYFQNSMLLSVKNTSSTIITNSDDYRILINTGQIKEDESDLKNYLKLNKINKIDVIIYTSFSESEQSVLIDFCKLYGVKKIYINNSATDNSIEYLTKNITNTEVIKTEDTYYFVEDFGFIILEEINAVYINSLQSKLNFTLLATNKVSLAVVNYIKEKNLALEFVTANLIDENTYLELQEKFSDTIIFCKECQFGAKNIINSYNKIRLEYYYEI